MPPVRRHLLSSSSSSTPKPYSGRDTEVTSTAQTVRVVLRVTRRLSEASSSTPVLLLFLRCRTWRHLLRFQPIRYAPAGATKWFSTDTETVCRLNVRPGEVVWLYVRGVRHRPVPGAKARDPVCLSALPVSGMHATLLPRHYLIGFPSPDLFVNFFVRSMLSAQMPKQHGRLGMVA